MIKAWSNGLQQLAINIPIQNICETFFFRFHKARNVIYCKDRCLYSVLSWTILLQESLITCLSYIGCVVHNTDTIWAKWGAGAPFCGFQFENYICSRGNLQETRLVGILHIYMTRLSMCINLEKKNDAKTEQRSLDTARNALVQTTKCWREFYKVRSRASPSFGATPPSS